MERVRIFIALLGFAFYYLNAQNHETVNVKELTGSADKSYIVNQYGVIRAPFSHTASSQGAFFLRANPTPDQDPSQNKNFVRTEAVLTEVTSEAAISLLPFDQKSTTYEYYDGLGRPILRNARQSSPLGNDVISYTMYDYWGRVPEVRLPYVANQKTGSFRDLSVIDDEQESFYVNTQAVTSDAKPYSYNIYENSPLNRINKSYGVGADWHETGSNKPVVGFTRSNTSSEVYLWQYDSITVPIRASDYMAGVLSVAESIDEQGQITQIFTNFRGQTILSRVGNGTVWFDTYNVYDYTGALRFVFPPEASSRILSEYMQSGTDKQDFLDRWCFQYKYDDQQRLVAKRVPGWEPGFWENYIYDKWNRIVFSQTPAQSARNEWLFTKYDLFNREILTGLYMYTSAGDVRANLQINVNNFYSSNPNNRFESEASNSDGYTLTTTYPTSISSDDLISIKYYDNYSFLTPSNNWETDIALSNFSYQNINGYPQYIVGDANASEIFHAVKGYPTGAKIRVLGDPRWLNSVIWYNKKYSPIQAIGENFVGGYDRATTKVKHSGQIENVLKEHLSSVGSVTILREFTYDHAGRLLKTYQTTDGNKILLTSNNYNELGQLIEENIHSTNEGSSFLQSVDMRYNIRGWLTNINNSTLNNDGNLNNDTNDLFGMELLYNPAVPPIVDGYQTQKLFDGNISAIKWKTDTQQASSQQNIFGFEYGDLKRFKKAYFATNNSGAWTGNAGMYQEHVKGYDKNGNISGILRSGKIDGALTSFDDLTHNYTLNGKVSNRLINLSDAANNTFGFKDGSSLNVEFQYDRSGNLVYDNNKQISNIIYNHLNLPTVVEFTRPDNSIDRIEYTYNALGIKLKTNIKIGNTRVWTTDYVGGVQYDRSQNDGVRKLSFVATSTGRIVKNVSGWDHEYFYRDHQNNVRLTFGHFKETTTYRATMEDPPSPSTLGGDESSVFRNITSPNGVTTRHPDGTFNYTKSSDKTLVPDKSSRTNAFLSAPIGPAKRLTLAAGDKVKMEVMARYNVVTGNTATIAASALIYSLANTTFQFGSGETGYSSFNSNAGAIPGIPGASTTLPKAYLAYIFFDLNFQFIPGNSSAISISTNAFDAFEKLERTFIAPQAGYLYVYVVNESNVSATAGSVYWDEMVISHQKTNNTTLVTQATDYYPLGLTFNSFQGTRLNENLNKIEDNRHKLQGQEFQADFDFNVSQFEARMYDGAIGRWTAADPLAERDYYSSPFNYLNNSSVNNIDLDGRTWWPHYALVGGMIDTRYSNMMNNSINAYYRQQYKVEGWIDQYKDAWIAANYRNGVFDSKPGAGNYGQAYRSGEYGSWIQFLAAVGGINPIAGIAKGIIDARDGDYKSASLELASAIAEIGPLLKTAKSLNAIEQITTRLSKHLDFATENYTLSSKQIAAGTQYPNLMKAYIGSSIDRLFKSQVRADNFLNSQGVKTTGLFKFGPDAYKTDVWWDVTTPAQWITHLNKYSPNYGQGIPLYYTIPTYNQATNTWSITNIQYATVPR